MCHTGRVYSPIVEGKRETFRLVGANHFNAIFEDSTTGSWWYQATGECVVGPRKGNTFKDISFFQGTASEMMSVNTSRSISLFLADTATGDKYDWSRGFARRKGDTTQALGRKSIVIGIDINGVSRAYPRHSLVVDNHDSIVTDSVNGIVIAFIRPASFNTNVFIYRDSISSGVIVPSYEEYWLSWKHFHPTTSVWTAR